MSLVFNSDVKVSIITTCYNRENTICNAITSVLSQNYNNIEYIVVDGDSTDNSMNIINQFRNEVSVIISEPDTGMYEAINKGIRTSTGDIIGLLHSDDFLYSSDTVSKIVRVFENTNADIVYGNGLFVDYNDTNKVVRKWLSGSFSNFKIMNGWLPLHPTVYMRRECFEKMGLYDESFKIAADSDFLIRCFYRKSLKIIYLNDYIVRMRMGGLSTDVRKMKEKWGEDLRLYKAHGFNPYWALCCKILSKIPQFIRAKFE